MSIEILGSRCGDEPCEGAFAGRGKDSASIFVTGNTVTDATKHTVVEDYSHPELDCGCAGGERVWGAEVKGVGCEKRIV